MAVTVVAVTDHGSSATIPAGPATTTQQPARPYGVQVMLPFTGLHNPVGVAVDSAGTVYVADSNNDRVLKLAARIKRPDGAAIHRSPRTARVAVDSAGTVYVADSDSGVLMLTAGSTTQKVLPFTGRKSPSLSNPNGLAVDSAGSVYITDIGDPRVLKLSPGSSTQTVLPFTFGGHSQGIWVAVDSAGNVYVTNFDENSVLRLAAGSNDQTVLPFSGLLGPYGLALDSAGTVYVADIYNDRVSELGGGI